MESPDPSALTPIPHAGAKALGLMALAGALLAAFVVYVMAARGVFEDTQRLVLAAENAEGVSVGTELTFSGFAIGRVSRIELGADGKALILVDVPVRDARWLRISSVFTLERGPVGGARLRAFTGALGDPPLPAGARRDVLIGDATAGIPMLVANLSQVVENLQRLTAAGSALSASLDNVRTLTGAMTGRQGALPAILGQAVTRRLLETIERTNRLIGRADATVGRTGELIGRADARLFGKDGLTDEAQEAVADVRVLLGEVGASLKTVDAALDDVRAIAANARVATEDLDVLRGEVDASLRKVSRLIEEINRKWPFARERELKLP